MATIAILTEPGFLEAVEARGIQLIDGLRDVEQLDASLRHVRSRGLMVATEFDSAERTAAVVEHCLEQHHLILMPAGTCRIPRHPVDAAARRQRRRGVRSPVGVLLRHPRDGLRGSGRCPGSTPPWAGVWRCVQAIVSQIERGIDDELRADWDIPLGGYDVLASLQRLGGRARPLDVANDLRLPPSSLSRRFDRLEEEGACTSPAIGTSTKPICGRSRSKRTRTGRRLWREMNVSYRRAVQALFAVHLDGADVADLQRVVDLLVAAGDDIEPIED